MYEGHARSARSSELGWVGTGLRAADVLSGFDAIHSPAGLSCGKPFRTSTGREGLSHYGILVYPNAPL